MPDDRRDLVIVMTHGVDHELSSVAFTIANGGLTAGLQVSIFLTGAADDLVRKGAIDMTHVSALRAAQVLLSDCKERCGTLRARTLCVRARGYELHDLIEGVVIAGASVMHERIKAAAATRSF